MSTATLKTRLSDSVKDAMRAKAAERLTTLRFLLAANSTIILILAITSIFIGA